MARSKAYGGCGLSLMHDLIRCNIGYGKVFSKKDLYMPMACTTRMLLPPGASTDSLLEDMVKYRMLNSFGDKEDPQYLLLRSDERKEPVLGFNPKRR